MLLLSFLIELQEDKIVLVKNQFSENALIFSFSFINFYQIEKKLVYFFKFTSQNTNYIFEYAIKNCS